MLARRLIDRFEVETGEDMAYAREIAREAPAAFWKLMLSGPVIGHRGAAPSTLTHLAKLGAMQVEDCGPCLQTAVRYAQRDGAPRALLQAALAGGAELPQLERDAYFFGRGVAGGEPIDDHLRERLHAAIGRRGLADLTVAVAAVRIFPALKRGLGYARSCALVEVDA